MEFIDTLLSTQLCSEEFFESLIIERVVGVGGFGEASLARDHDGNHYIIKSMDIDMLIKRNFPMERLKGEIVNLFEITAHGCPYVCKIICVYLDKDYLNIVQDDCGEELAERINSKNYTPEQALKWTEQILDALNCIHSLNIVHFDIKPQNILVDKNDDIKIIDFGMSMHKNEYSKVKSIGGTPGYILAQSLIDKTYDFRNDSYATGITLKQLWQRLGNIPPQVKQIISGLSENPYVSIINMKTALNLLNPSKYPLAKLKLSLEDFEKKLDGNIQDEIEYGFLNPDEDDMETERKRIAIDLIEQLKGLKIELSNDIIQKYE